MTLPRPQLRPGYDDIFVGGSGFEDFNALLLELHQGVLELGAPEVRCQDEPQFRESGFCLTDKNDPSRYWSFLISADDLRGCLYTLPGRVREAIKTARGRMQLAALLEAGAHPEQLEAKLGDSSSCARA